MKCETNADCSGHPDAVACQSRFCVDSRGERIEVSKTSDDAGSQEQLALLNDDATSETRRTVSAVPDAAGSGKPNAAGLGETDEIEVSSAGDTGKPDRIAERDAGSGLAGNGGSASNNNSSADSTGEDDSIEDDLTEICDGSDDLRLLMTLEGGNLLLSQQMYHFFMSIMAKYSLFVDGQRHYWIIDIAGGDIRSGVLNDQESDQLSFDIDYDRFWELTGTYPGPQCIEGDRSVMSNGIDSITCLCFCPDAPASVSEVLEGAEAWMARLDEKAGLFEGPLNIAIVPIDEPASTEVYDWPLDWSPSEIASQAETEADWALIDWENEGKFIEDPVELERLWQILTGTSDTGYQYLISEITIRDSENEYYKMFVRPELPVDLKTKFEAFVDKVHPDRRTEIEDYYSD